MTPTPVPPWMLDADEVLDAPHADLARSPVSVRLYVGDLEARVRDLESIAEELRADCLYLQWPASGLRQVESARPRGKERNLLRALGVAA